MPHTLNPQTSAGRLVPAPEPTREWQASREGSDSYVYTGDALAGSGDRASSATTYDPTVSIWRSRYQAWEDQFLREIWPRAQFYWQLYRNIDEGIIPGPAGEWRDRTILPTIFKIIEAL